MDREVDGRKKTSGIGGARQRRIAHEVKRRAVIDRRADERQAERDVNAVAEARGFEHR